MERPITLYHLAARKGLRSFTEAVNTYQPSDLEHFRDIVCISTMHFDVHIQAIARKSNTDCKTVIAWADGLEIPPFATRAEVQLFILEKLGAKLPPTEPEY